MLWCQGGVVYHTLNPENRSWWPVDALITPIAASLAVLAISFAAISLVLHWIRRKEHPDVSQVRAELNTLRGELAELWDKFTYQQRRDRVRRLRESREREQAPDDQVDEATPEVEATSKDALRRLWRQKMSAG